MSEDLEKSIIRRLILTAATTWLSVTELQAEVNAAREKEAEKAGAKAEFVPVQVVQQIVEQLTEQGVLEKRTLADDGNPDVYQVRTSVVRGRRAAVLAKLFFEEKHVAPAAQLLAKAGQNEAVLEDLLDQGLLGKTFNELGELIALPEKIAVEIVDAGAEAVVAKRMPEAAPDAVAASVDDFTRKTLEQLETERERRVKAESKLFRAIEWLKDKGIEIEGLIEAPPTRNVPRPFTWTQSRKIDDAEKGLILMEVLELERQKSLVQLQFDGQKSKFKAETERLDAEISALKSAAQCSSRVISVVAYKETDWNEHVVIVRAVEDDRELDREPIPKGAQKTIPGTDAPSNGAAANGTVPSPVKAKMPALREALLAVLGGVTEAAAMKLPAIIAAVVGRYDVEERGLEKLLRAEIGKAIKEKAIGHKGTTFFALPVETAASDAPNGSPPDEPGPLASPERRKRGKKKKADAAAEAQPS